MLHGRDQNAHSKSRLDRQAIEVQDFFQKDCWKHHPKPYKEYMDWRFKEDEKLQMQRNRLVPGN